MKTSSSVDFSITHWIIFDGSLSYDPDEDGSITEWFWYFGDGTQGTGEKEAHIYSAPGEYNVILTVTDNYGAKDNYETIAKITQPNRPPSAPTIEGETNGSVNVEYTYTVVSTDADNDTIKYTIEWGDGNINESEFLPNGTPFIAYYSWTAAGEYVVTVTVTDRKTSKSVSMPVIIGIHRIGDIGLLIDIDGDGSYDVFRNTTTGHETDVGQDNKGNYLIDIDGNGDIDFIYDPLSGSMTPYESEESLLDIPIAIIALIVAVVIISLIILALFKFGYLYIDEKPIKKPIKRNKGKNRHKT